MYRDTLYVKYKVERATSHGIWSKGLQVKRSTSQRSPSQKVYKSKGPQVKKGTSQKGSPPISVPARSRPRTETGTLISISVPPLFHIGTHSHFYVLNRHHELSNTYFICFYYITCFKTLLFCIFRSNSAGWRFI